MKQSRTCKEYILDSRKLINYHHSFWKYFSIWPKILGPVYMWDMKGGASTNMWR